MRSWECCSRCHLRALLQELLTEDRCKVKTTENMYRSITQQCNFHQWARSLNRYVEMVHTVSRYMARFTIWHHCYTQMRHICQDIFCFAEATTKQHENQSNWVCMAAVIKWLDNMLWHVNPFSESYKWIHGIKWNNL